ncbi:3-keto-disaccharide hydrolase [Pontiella sulfatireligans]|uniref:3-keto-alpha-glucoside-1,2-lyase/3-keto-2-hydroxy-glucal hydratase domain-containing protein n=1 Tax=Pontiella sulfatireligans TaxID=2750658 RepID=A0A6C2UPK2_9BACT|nr:DUF1080 domain-containing protein [Pontiella sulfatireligans]VGO22205.1 hypothetical protein SCARR_04287 [Pontiella sulfatireligans]
MNMKQKCVFGLSGLMLLALASTLHAEPVPKELLGDWSLELDSGLPAWMRVAETNGQPLAFLRLYVGPAGPHRDAKIENGRLKFEIRKKNKKSKSVSVQTIDVGTKDGKLDGVIVRSSPNGRGEREAFTGKKIPPMPASAPNLAKVRFGKPITLFNGKDMTGWRVHESDKVNGWAAVDGTLKNSTPKTDFSATGAYANLRTEEVFGDFRLHIEFLIGTNRNSGVYLRGMYEAQVVDRDSRMQGMQGVGAIFGTIAPSHNAGKAGGEWQSYDITLVDRHFTVVLNGEKVIDNQPVSGPTAGAIFTNPAAPGPIYLQGDHTTVAYRNIYLEPVVSQK